jgi:V8-like Glu-specific endopeptidase
MAPQGTALGSSRSTGGTQTFSRAEGRAAIHYWTHRRMVNATPMNMRAVPNRDGTTVRPPAPATVGHGFLGGSSPGSKLVSPVAVATSEGYWQYSTTAAPAMAIGRLFFRTWNPLTGAYRDSSCSATVIAAENRSTVWTAGHCVFQTFSNIWNRAYVFCPGYRDTNGVSGEAADCPLGKWSVHYQNTTPQWQNATCDGTGRCQQSEFNHDFGALVMYGLNGYSIQGWVGSHVLRYNTVTADHYAFGYPADPLTGYSFNGRYLYVCIATNITEHGHLRQPCHMTGGASGGPWLAAFNLQWRGWVDTVNSHGGGASGYMDGPYQGLSAQTLYNSVRSAT